MVGTGLGGKGPPTHCPHRPPTAHTAPTRARQKGVQGSALTPREQAPEDVGMFC